MSEQKQSSSMSARGKIELKKALRKVAWEDLVDRTHERHNQPKNRNSTRMPAVNEKCASPRRILESGGGRKRTIQTKEPILEAKKPPSASRKASGMCIAKSSDLWLVLREAQTTLAR